MDERDAAAGGATDAEPRSSTGMRTQAVRAFVSIAVVLGLGVGVVVLANALGSDEDRRPARIAAPTVVIGNADAVVLATMFDGDGARAQIPPEVVDAVRGVDGVAAANGALRRFVQAFPAPGSEITPSVEASERSAIALSAEGAAVAMTQGRLPESDDEVAVNTVLADRLHLALDGDVVVRTAPVNVSPCTHDYATTGTTVCSPIPGGNNAPVQRVVGVFTPPGGDVDDVKLVALTTNALQSMTNGAGYDRIDIEADDGEDLEGLLDRVGAVLPDGFIVVPGSVVGSTAQMRDELEIQRAYHWLLSLDPQKQGSSHQDPTTPPDPNRWGENVWQIVNTEMRVSRVAFVDTNTAIVTYAIYYGPQRSSLAPDPFTGLVLRIDGVWQLSSQDICQLSAIEGPGCPTPADQDLANFVVPPEGWSRPSIEPDLLAAFRVLADPTATLDDRVAAVQDGESLREVIAAGLTDDAPRAGAVAFNVTGVRTLDADHAQILYSLVADGGPHLETPYPLVASAVRVDGTWRATRRYACGLQALAGNTCTVPATTTSTSTTTSSGASTSTGGSTSSGGSTSTTSTTSPPSTTTTVASTTTLPSSTSTTAA